MKRSIWISIVVVAVGLCVVLGAANLFLGDLNQDEGWYLYAAKQVASGEVLYRDFMFTQGPVFPLVYGVVFPIVGKLGVAGGRLITMLFGLGSVGLAAWLAARSAKRFSRPAALCALALAGVNVYQSYFTTIVKTYSLCAFFLTAGFVALSFANGKRGASGAFWGGVLLALAACTRLSAGVVLPIVGIWLIVNRKRVFPLAWVAFGLGGGVVLAGLLGSFFVMVPENTHFALLGYHAGRSPGGVVELMALKAGFVSRFVQAYFLFSVGCVLALVFRKQRTNDDETPFAHRFVSLLWLSGAAITLVHFSAPFPYDDYQVVVFPVLVAALVATLVPRCPEKMLGRVALVVLLGSTAASFSSPINQSWLVRGRDRIWWEFKDVPDLVSLQRTGAKIREQLGEDGLLLTQDAYLAIEAGASLPHGLQMGPFSYYPEMSTERAETLNLLNEEMLLSLFSETSASVAAFSGYGLTIESPSIGRISSKDWKALRSVLEMNYSKTSEIPSFGQAHTTLEVFKRITNNE